MSSSEAPLESPEYDNVEEGLDSINREEAVDTEEGIQGDEEAEYANDGADNAEAENAADDEAAAWHDDGYASATPSQPNHEDSSWWNAYVDIETLQQTTAREYGAFIGGGTVLAWRGNNTGKSVIVGYRCHGKIIGRLEAAARRRVDTSEGGHAHISATCRGKKKIPGTDDYWSQEYINGMGTVAWRVEPEYADDPTSVLIPMNKAWYPETYVGVIWCDNRYTWESRDCLRFIMGSKNYETDVAIYRLAISQDGDYQESLTGTRPWYPNPGERPNQHWRNVNSFQGAYWKTPRARKESRVVRIEEIPVNGEEEANADEEMNEEEEEYAEEEANTEEGIEGEEFEPDAEAEVQGDQDNSESRGPWQPSGLGGYGEAPPPYITPAASREGSAIPDGSRRRRLPPINEDEEFHTPYTPNAFNDRYRSRSAGTVNGSQQGTPGQGSRAGSGSRENTPSRPPSVTPMRGSRENLVSQRATPNQPPSGSQRRRSPTQPLSGSQRGAPTRSPTSSRQGTPRQTPPGSQRMTPNQPSSESQRSTPNQALSGSRSSMPSQPPSTSQQGTPPRPPPGSQQGTPTRPPSRPRRVTPNQQPSGSQRGTPTRQPPGSQRSTPNESSSGSQRATPNQPPSGSLLGTPTRPPSGSRGTPNQPRPGSQGGTPSQPLPGSQRATPNQPSSGSQRGMPTQRSLESQRGAPSRQSSGSQRSTPNQLPSRSQQGTPERGNQPPSSQGNRRHPASAQSSSDSVAQPRVSQRSSNRAGNGRRGQRQNPHRQARRPNILQ